MMKNVANSIMDGWDWTQTTGCSIIEECIKVAAAGGITALQ